MPLLQLLMEQFNTPPTILYHSTNANKQSILSKGILSDEYDFVYLSAKPIDKYKYTFKVEFDNNNKLYDGREVWGEGNLDKEYNEKYEYYIHAGDIDPKHIVLLKDNTTGEITKL